MCLSLSNHIAANHQGIQSVLGKGVVVSASKFRFRGSLKLHEYIALCAYHPVNSCITAHQGGFNKSLRNHQRPPSLLMGWQPCQSLEEPGYKSGGYLLSGQGCISPKANRLTFHKSSQVSKPQDVESQSHKMLIL